jgi:hypothetical protein
VTVSHRFEPQNRWRQFISGLASKPLGCFSPVWPQNRWRRFMSGLTSKPLRRFLIRVGLKTDGYNLSVVWPQNY